MDNWQVKYVRCIDHASLMVRGRDADGAVIQHEGLRGGGQQQNEVELPNILNDLN